MPALPLSSSLSQLLFLTAIAITFNIFVDFPLIISRVALLFPMADLVPCHVTPLWKTKTNVTTDVHGIAHKNLSKIDVQAVKYLMYIPSQKEPKIILIITKNNLLSKDFQMKCHYFRGLICKLHNSHKNLAF